MLTGLLMVLCLLPGLLQAADRKMVIQLNSKDGLTQKMVLLNAKNLKTQLGMDKIDVEIVVYGPGLAFVRSTGWASSKVSDLMAKYGVKVSVCNGALNAYKKRHNGEELDMVPGVNRVKTGAIRILELQEQGYAYLRP